MDNVTIIQKSCLHSSSALPATNCELMQVDWLVGWLIGWCLMALSAQKRLYHTITSTTVMSKTAAQSSSTSLLSSIIAWMYMPDKRGVNF